MYSSQINVCFYEFQRRINVPFILLIYLQIKKPDKKNNKKTARKT